MSYSLQEPDWPVVCECTYDEERDEMDRENCPLHYHLEAGPQEAQTAQQERKPQPERKPPATAEPGDDEAAA